MISHQSQQIIQNSQDNQVLSVNLSMKLLNIVAKQQITSLSPISTMQQLSNRLKMANNIYNRSFSDRQATKQWIKESGIKLAPIYKIAMDIRKQKPRPKNQRNFQTWEQYESINANISTLNDFIHQNQQRIVCVAIKSKSLSINKNHHLTNLRKDRMTQLTKSIKQRPKEIVCDDPKELNEEILMRILLDEIIKMSPHQNLSYLPKLHLKLLNIFEEQKYFAFHILYAQIQSINQHYNSSSQQDMTYLRNMIRIMTIKKMQEHFEKDQNYDVHQLKNQNFIEDNYYFIQNKQQAKWASVYFDMRKGKIEECLLKNNLTYELRLFEKAINKFESVDISSRLDENGTDGNPLRLLKSIVLGTYKQRGNCFKKFDLLDQPWIILCSLGVNRTRNAQRGAKIFIDAVDAYAKKQANQHKYNFNLATGLICLGDYTTLMNQYKKAKRQNRLNPIDKIALIHILILIASNITLYKVMQLKNGQGQSLEKFIEDILIEMIEFTKHLTNKQHFQLYLVILLELISQLNLQQASYHEKMVKLGSTFKLHIEDITFINRITMKGRVRSFLEGLLLNLSIQSDKEYFDLASICEQIGIASASYHFLVKFIIIKYLEQQSQFSQLSIVNFTDRAWRQSQKNIDLAFNTLQNYAIRNKAQQGKQQLIHFLKDYQELNTLLKMKNMQGLNQKAKKLERYRHLAQPLLNILVGLQKIDKMDYTSIYVIYYEKLLIMYEVTYQSTNNISKIPDIRMELKMQILKIKSYLTNFKRVGQLIARLQK